jgi:hypothetical protein
MSDFTDETGMALVEAFTVNEILRKITLSLDPLRHSLVRYGCTECVRLRGI